MARLVTAGRVGRPHGLDGSFAVAEVQHRLEAGTIVHIAGRRRRVEHRAGSDDRPLIRVGDVGTRELAAALGGELVLVTGPELLAEREWLAEDLIGCRVEGLGEVRRVVGGPSCDVLELDGGALVPLVSDAVTSVDPQTGRIEVNRRFLGMDP